MASYSIMFEVPSGPFGKPMKVQVCDGCAALVSAFDTAKHNRLHELVDYAVVTAEKLERGRR